MQLQSPPRTLLLPVRIQALFGGVMNQLGWIFFGFGLIFVFIFALDGLIAAQQFRGPLMQAQATVVEVYETNAEVSDVEVVGHHYRFEVQGVSYEGTSFITGQEVKEGSVVPILYQPDNPLISRIDLPGFRAIIFGGVLVWITALFPLMGLIFIVIGLSSGRKSLHLLRWGELATGRLIAKEATNTEINDETVYKLTFSFQVKGKTYETIAKTHLPYLLEDEQKESLFYLPTDPRQAVLKDAIPGHIYIDQRGQIQTQSPNKSLLLLLAPVAGFIINGLILMAKFS